MERPDLSALEPYLRSGISFFPHQIEGVEWMWNKKSFILADDPGLGKSVMSLTVAAIHAKLTKDTAGRDSKFLIVCPSSLKRNWADEIGKFTMLPVVVLSGERGVRDSQIVSAVARQGTGFLVVSYDQLRIHAETLSQVRFDMVIADEAHYLKNAESARTEAFRGLNPGRRIMVTGTPILNQADDLWTMLDAVQPKAWGTYRGFTATFCVFGGHKGKQVVGIKNEARLAESVAKVMLRRKKEEVLDLPEVQIIERTVELHDEQRKAYESAVSDMVLDRGDVIFDSEGERVEEEIPTPMVRFLRLKQICSTLATIRTDTADVSAKLDAATDDAKIICAGGEKIVVFTGFRATQACYVNRLLKALPGVPIWVLNGDIEADERQEIINAWSATQGAAIIVALIQVAGVGLNMTAARHVQFIELDVTPANNLQAISRVHRIGAKDKPIQVWQYEAADTVDQRVNEIIAAKNAVSNSVIEVQAAESVIATEMSKELSR